MEGALVKPTLQHPKFGFGKLVGFGHAGSVPVYNRVFKAAVINFFFQVRKIVKITIRRTRYVAVGNGAINLNNGLDLTCK